MAQSVSQVSYFTVPPRAHPSTGSQSGSAAPGPLLCTVPVNRHRREPGHRRAHGTHGHTDHTDEPHNHPNPPAHGRRSRYSCRSYNWAFVAGSPQASGGRVQSKSVKPSSRPIAPLAGAGRWTWPLALNTCARTLGAAASVVLLSCGVLRYRLPHLPIFRIPIRARGPRARGAWRPGRRETHTAPHGKSATHD